MEKLKYKEMVEKASPNSNLKLNCINAFWIGGSICVIGEMITQWFLNSEFALDDARMYTSVVLIFFGVLMTGIGVYDKLGKHAGAGSVVPITGFANSVAAPAMEFKKEGFIFGVGAKIFVIAGPVIVYGILSSMVVGIFYYLMR